MLEPPVVEPPVVEPPVLELPSVLLPVDELPVDVWEPLRLLRRPLRDEVSPVEDDPVLSPVERPAVEPL